MSAFRVGPIASLLGGETAWAARRLARTPAFTLVAILTVGVAVAPSLIFRLVDHAVLPPLPFERAEELVSIRERAVFGRRATSYPKLGLLRARSRTMEVAALRFGAVYATRADETFRFQLAAVTPNFFSVLGAKPRLGRFFREDENLRPFDHPFVVLGEPLWRKRFGARPDVIGEKVMLNGDAFFVLGVMSQDFHQSWLDWTGMSSPEAWIPAMMAPVTMLGDWRHRALVVERPQAWVWGAVARLKTGHTLTEARAEAVVVDREIARRWPDDDGSAPAPFDLVPLNEEAVDPKVFRAVSLLTVAGGLVLLLGALNLANLFLARGLERAKAQGLRALLGAPRLALLWGALSESVFVGGAGALVAVALTRGALGLLAFVEPTILTAPFGVTFDPAAWRADGRLVAMATAVSVATAVVAGLAPAWRTTRLEAASFWRGGAGITGGGLRRLRLTRPRGLLVALETAVALAVTLPALLLVRSLGSLVTADLGFRPGGVAAAELRLPTASYKPPAAAVLIDEAVHRLDGSAGVESASWVECLPIDCGFYTSALTRTGAPDTGLLASVHVVAPNAFRTLGIDLRAGRDFGPGDRADGPPVVILSEHAARRLGGARPGLKVEASAARGGPYEVVGIVADVPYRDLASEPFPAVYFPLTQRPVFDGVLVARARGGAKALAGAMRQAVASLDPRLEALAVADLGERVDLRVARFRGAAWLLGVAGALSLFLAAVGIYGILWSLVAQSVREIAIRIALGASPAAVGRSIAGAALRLAAMGLGVGAALGSWGATYLQGYLFGVRPFDARALLVAFTVTTVLALVAALRPARRASRADPMAVLRSE